MTRLGRHLVLNQCFNQTISVINVTESISRSFGNGTVNKSRHYVLTFLPGLFMDQCFNKPVNKISHYLIDMSLT